MTEQPDLMDDDGNYYQDDSSHRLPEEVSRGSAPQRLNMKHGFMKHIEHNQNARSQYESQNPSSSIQQRYFAKPHSPVSWRRNSEDPGAPTLHRRGNDRDDRYQIPKDRQQTEPAAPSASRTALSPAGGPGNPLLEQSIPELQYTDGAVLASSEAAEMRRQRKFREGFAAYTAPPLLSKRSVSHPAAVQHASSAALSSASSEAAQQSHGHAGAAATALPAAGSAAPHPLPSYSHPPGYPSASTTPRTSTAQSSVSPGQNGNATVPVGSGALQPTHVPLAPHRHGTWSLEGEEDDSLHVSEHDAVPGYGAPGSGPPARQTSAVAHPSSLRAAGTLSVQSGTDRPPGFAETATPEQSKQLGSDGTAVTHSTEDHPPGFALPPHPPPHTHQSAQHSTADQPSGFHQPGALLPVVGNTHLDSAVAASFTPSTKPAEPALSGRSSGKANGKGRTQASAAVGPLAPASASQLPPAARAAPADGPPGFQASPSPSFQLTEGHPTGLLPTSSQGRTATSSHLHPTTASSQLQTSDTAETPPGFAAAGVGSSQMHIHGSQQSPARAMQAQKTAQGPTKAQQQQQQQQQQTTQAAKQTHSSQGGLSATSAVAGDELPPGFPTRSQSHAVQSASSHGQLQLPQGSLPSSVAAVGDDLPPGFLAHVQSSAPAAHSASSRRQPPVPPSPHAPKVVSVTRLPSGPTAQQRPSGQPPTLAAAPADDLPPGFPTAPSSPAAPVSHPGSNPARPSRTASAQPSVPPETQSGWDIDEAETTAASSQPRSHAIPQHAPAAVDDHPPGFATPAQQPTSASRPSLAASRRQLPVVCPVLERRVSVTKLATTPITALTAAASSSSVNAPAQPSRTVPVTRVPAPPSSGPTSASSLARRQAHSQAMLQPPVAAPAGDSSTDLPPGFSTMQRSASTPGASAAAAETQQGTAVDAVGSTASAAQAAADAAADLPPGFDAASQDLTDLRSGVPADMGLSQAFGVVGVPKSSRKDGGRRAESALPQAGLPRSDARRKAQIPKAASDNLGELPPGFAASHPHLVQSQAGAKQAGPPHAPYLSPGYRPGHLAHGSPAGGQQGAEKQTPATPPCSRTSGPPDLPPGFAASAVRSNPQQTPRASQSTSGVAPPQMPTPSFAGHQASGAHQQGWLSHGGSVAASNDQSEMLQRAPASDPHRPQRTLTQAAGRGPPAQASDRPPGFSAVATPQPQGSHRRGLPPSPSSSWPHTSTQVQPESHRAPNAAAPGCVPAPLPSTARPNVQDARQSIYDPPRRQPSNTTELQDTPSGSTPRSSRGPAQHDSAAVYSRAGTNAAAADPDAAEGFAVMDVRQSMYDIAQPQDPTPSNSSSISPCHSHHRDSQALTLQPRHTRHQVGSPNQQPFRGSGHSHPSSRRAGNNRQWSQSHEAYPSRLVGAEPIKPSDDCWAEPAYQGQQSEEGALHRGASLPPPVCYGAHSQQHQMHHSADHAQHAQHEWQPGHYDPQHAQREWHPGQYELQHAQHEHGVAQNEWQPTEYEAQHAQHDPEAAQHEWQPSQYQAQHAQHDPEAAQYEWQPSQYEAQHAQHERGTAQYAWPGQYELQHTQHEQEAAQYEWQPSPYEAQHAQHDPEAAQYEWRHAQRTQHEWQHAQRTQHEWQNGQRDLQHAQHEWQHAQHDPDNAQFAQQAQYDYQNSARLRHDSPHRSAADTTVYSQPMFEQASPATQGISKTEDTSAQHGHRGNSANSAASSARHSSMVRHSRPAVPAASAAAALVSHPGSLPARHANTACYQVSNPPDTQSGWDIAEAAADASPGRAHSGLRHQSLSCGASSSLDSTQEADLWDLVNEEPHQVGLNVHQQQAGSLFNKHNKGYHHAQHSTRESSQQSSQQNSSRFPSSRPSSADSSTHVYQPPHSRRGQGISSATQSRRGGVQSVGRLSQAGSTEEQSGSLGTRRRTPQKLKHAVRLMSWVRPKPKPASKLESVKWEEEKPTGPPWKNLKALTREKKGWGWSTDEEPDPARAVMPPSAEYCDELQLWRSHGPSFLFRKLEPPRPVGLDVEWSDS